MSRLSLASLAIVLPAIFAGCQSKEPIEDNLPRQQRAQSEQLEANPSKGLLDDLDLTASDDSGSPVRQSRIRFVDVHAESGLNFVFDNGASDQKLMPESTSCGAGWVDFDKDGRPDLYFAQGGDSGATGWSEQPVDQLYRNLDSQRFEKVTNQAALTDSAFGHGVCVGDYNNDGFDDVFVSNVGLDALYENMGDGTFCEVTKPAKIDNFLWAASAAWGDLDLDGDLDLFVCNYVDYNPLQPIACFDKDGSAGTCHPSDVNPVPNKAYFNQGDGTFREESQERGLLGPGSKSLGVVIADFTGDFLPDVYVANDTEANHMFVNQGEGRFEENAVVLGCAMGQNGEAQASMGIAYGDYDRNGFPDLYVAHFTTDSNTLYQNLGEVGFTDATRGTGLHLPTLDYLAFGTVMSDIDLNGWQDLFVTNGHIDDWREIKGDYWKMRSQMFSFHEGHWQDCSETAGLYFQKKRLGRAVAAADYDDDGDLDILVVDQNDPVGLLRNDSQKGHGIRVRFIGESSNRNGIGAEVTMQQNDLILVSQLPGGSSYAASNELVLTFGLGDSDAPCRASVRWPSGRQQRIENIEVDSSLIFYERDAK